MAPCVKPATEQNARLSTVCVLAFFLNDAAHAAQDSNAFFPIPGDTRVDPADDDATTAREPGYEQDTTTYLRYRVYL